MRKFFPLRFLSALLAGTALAALVAGHGQAAGENVLNVYNWSDYIAEDTLAKFTKATGIKVSYDVYDSNDVLEAKLLAGSTGYDIVVPSLVFLARQIKAGIFQKLNKDAIPNLRNLDPDINSLATLHDRDNSYSVTYMWGTTGIGYNVQKVKERLGADTPLDSWGLLMDPDTVAKLADCGVTALDAADEGVLAALTYSGLAPQSQRASDINKAFETFSKARPHIRYFNSSQYINDLANGNVCLSLGWSGDILIARDRAIEANNGIEIKYLIPKEGALLWIDLMAIPSDAPHPENAHKFINFILEPQITAGITNYVNYANGNAASTPFIDEAILNDPGVYPSKATRKALFIAPLYSPRTDRLLARQWTKLKTGK